MHVYVAPALRKRMRDYDDKINWSRVAAKAFEQAILDYHQEMNDRAARVAKRRRLIERHSRGEHLIPTNANTMGRD